LAINIMIYKRLSDSKFIKCLLLIKHRCVTSSHRLLAFVRQLRSTHKYSISLTSPGLDPRFKSHQFWGKNLPQMFLTYTQK